MERIEKHYRENYKRLVNTINRALGGDYAAAEDTVQEAFCRAIKYKNSFRPSKGEFEVWFNKILFNTMRDIQQGMRATPQELKEEFSYKDVLPNSLSLDAIAFRKVLHERIQNVENDKHRRVLDLFYILGYTSREIMEVEKSVSVSNITTITNRFKQELFKDMKWENKQILS